MVAKIPANVLGVINNFNDIVNMNFLPKEKIYDWVIAPITGKTSH
jgi:hypothetical protein